MPDLEKYKETIASQIYLLRGEQVLLDFDLAKLYGVETKNLKRAAKRNIERFPADFMLELSKEEYESLRCQFGTLNRGQHSKYLPYAFTEQGVAMLSGVLKSDRAVKANIEIMRAFVRMRYLTQSNQELAVKITELEKETKLSLSKQDDKIQAIFDAIKGLIESKRSKTKVGFV